MEAMMVVSLWRKSWSGLKKRCVLLPLRCATDERKSWAEKKHHVEQGVNEEMLEKCVTKFATRFFFGWRISWVHAPSNTPVWCDVTYQNMHGPAPQHTMRCFLSLVFYRAAPPAFLPSQQLHNHTTLQLYSGFISQLKAHLHEQFFVRDYVPQMPMSLRSFTSKAAFDTIFTVLRITNRLPCPVDITSYKQKTINLST